MADNIRVVARFRPLRSDEQRGGVCVDVLSETSVAVKAANAPGYTAAPPNPVHAEIERTQSDSEQSERAGG